MYSLPFKGRARVGMAYRHAAHLPIPLPTSPLKGEGEEHQRRKTPRDIEEQSEEWREAMGRFAQRV